MVVETNSFRRFQRTHNGVLIYLQLNEWPPSVPLPTGTALAQTGDGPFYPYWDLVLKADKTIEAIVGWFLIPLSLDGTIAWYQTEMAKCGWLERADQGYRMTSSAALHFERPATGVRVVVGLRDWPERQATDAMIRRVVVHPWQEPQTAEETAVVSEDEAMARAAEVAVAVGE